MTAARFGPGVLRALQAAIRGGLVRNAMKAGKGMVKYGGKALGAYEVARTLGALTPKKRKRNNSIDEKIIKKTFANVPRKMNFRKRKYSDARYAQSSGTFGGQFKSPSKQGANIKKEFLMKGMTDTSETHGLIDDPNCCFIMHSAIAYKRAIKIMSRALARKLFVKAGFNPTTSVETIPLFGAQADSLSMTIFDQNRNTLATYAATGTGNCTVAEFASTIEGQLLTYTNQPAPSNDKKVPVWIYLFQDPSDTVIASDNLITLSSLCLYDEVLNLMCSSDMKIQNRSNSASGTSNIDDVSNNPLVGRSYNFNYLPRAYTAGLDFFNSVSSQDGVKLLRAQEFSVTTGGDYMKEPPIPKTFRNCKTSSKIRLEPGQIKNYTIKEVVRKNILKWLEAIAFNNESQVTRLNCPVNLIALEDVINVNEEQLITLAYECQKEISVHFVTKKKVVMLTDFISSEVDNITPP